MSVAQRLQIALMVPPFYSGVRMSQHAQSLNLKQLSGIQPSLIVPVVFLLWQNLFLKKSQSAAKQNDGGEKKTPDDWMKSSELKLLCLNPNVPTPLLFVDSWTCPRVPKAVQP